MFFTTIALILFVNVQIEKLGSDSFDEREKATQALIDLPASSPLLRLHSTTDLEVKRRIEKVLATHQTRQRDAVVKSMVIIEYRISKKARDKNGKVQNLIATDKIAGWIVKSDAKKSVCVSVISAWVIHDIVNTEKATVEKANIATVDVYYEGKKYKGVILDEDSSVLTVRFDKGNLPAVKLAEKDDKQVDAFACRRRMDGKGAMLSEISYQPPIKNPLRPALPRVVSAYSLHKGDGIFAFENGKPVLCAMSRSDVPRGGIPQVVVPASTLKEAIDCEDVSDKRAKAFFEDMEKEMKEMEEEGKKSGPIKTGRPIPLPPPPGQAKPGKNVKVPPPDDDDDDIPVRPRFEIKKVPPPPDQWRIKVLPPVPLPDKK